MNVENTAKQHSVTGAVSHLALFWEDPETLGPGLAEGWMTAALGCYR